MEIEHNLGIQQNLNGTRIFLLSHTILLFRVVSALLWHGFGVAWCHWSRLGCRPSRPLCTYWWSSRWLGTRRSGALQGGGVLSYSTLFSVVTVCSLLLRIVEMILFAILFPVAIVEGDCQLIHGMEGGGFSLFPVCYQVLEAIWKSLIKAIA